MNGAKRNSGEWSPSHNAIKHGRANGLDDNFNGRVREGPGTRSRDMVWTHRARASDEDQP